MFGFAWASDFQVLSDYKDNFLLIENKNITTEEEKIVDDDELESNVADEKAKKPKKPKKAEKPKEPYNPERDIIQWLQTYSEAISTIQKKAFRKVDFAKFIKDSLKSAISNVDAHSAFFDNDEFKSTIETTSGEFSGIGVSIIGKTIDDDALVIIEVVRGGPAQKAGLKRGDKIVGVNKDKLRGLSTDEVITKLKGKVGSTLNLKIIRNKKPLSFTVKRDIIKDQTSVCYCFKEQKVYYLSLKHFAEVAAKQMQDLLEKANKGKCKGIILDLRSNPGGTLDSSIDMAGLFLPKNSIVVATKDRNGKTVAEYFTKSDPILKSDVPIFILINNFTASASEILAGCLRYHSEKLCESVKNPKKIMVFLVGTSTFGKGSVQELIPIKNGSALKLTTMLYFLPGMTSIQAEGVIPDFEVKTKMIPEDEIKWIKELYGKEISLKNHITVKEVKENLGLKVEAKDEEKPEKDIDKDESDLSGISGENGGDDNGQNAEKIENEKEWEQKQLKALGSDAQVQACVNMINMLAMIKKNKKKKQFDRKYALASLKKNYLTDDAVVVEKVE
jgi:carboxyl-terminal processing protease